MGELGGRARVKGGEGNNSSLFIDYVIRSLLEKNKGKKGTFV